MVERRSDHPPPLAPDEGWRTWLVGALFTLTLTLGGAGYQSMNTRVADLEQRGSPAMRERLAAQEERQAAIQAQLMRNSESMKRIEDKLDLALERMHEMMLPRVKP